MSQSKAAPTSWLTAASASNTAATTAKQEEQQCREIISETVPLGWTRIPERKRARVDDDVGNNDWNRCCGRQGCRHAARTTTVSATGTATNNSSNSTKLLHRRYSGQVVFCLHDSDPSWFQGYFFPAATATFQSKPWGLLASRREVDDCLACAEGGYRVIDLQVNYSVPPTDVPTRHTFASVEWTGADMMLLKSPHVSMRTERLSTGAKAATLAQQLFQGLFRKARQQLTVAAKDDTTTKTRQDDTLDLFPDICVVAGTMDLSLPVDASERDLYELMFND